MWMPGGETELEEFVATREAKLCVRWDIEELYIDQDLNFVLLFWGCCPPPPSRRQILTLVKRYWVFNISLNNLFPDRSYSHYRHYYPF